MIYSQDLYPAGGVYPVILSVEIKRPWYIHSTGKGTDYLIPTVLSFYEQPWIKIDHIRFPPPERKRFDYLDQEIELYSGKIFVRAEIVISKNAPVGRQVIKGRLSFQACSSASCLPPEDVPVKICIDVAAHGTGARLKNREIFQSGSELHKSTPSHKPNIAFSWTLLGIFFGGMALNLTPCIYPLIPITVSYFGGRSRAIHKKTIIHGMLYILGISSTNSVLGVSAGLSGNMLGSVLQNPLVLFVIAGILVSLALSFFGFWELRLPSGLTKVASKGFGGYLGSFFMGLTLGIVAAPCIGPFIIGLMTYVGQKGDPVFGFICFFVLSLGMGLPLFVLAIFSGAIERLPVSGEWMVWVRKLLGWVLVCMAGYMLTPLISGPLGVSIPIAVVLSAAGLHLGWLDKSGAGLRVFFYVKRMVGVVLILGSIFFLGRGFVITGPSVNWLPYDQGLIMDAKKRGMPVILDFYAEWCLPCRELDKKVFRDPEVVRLSKKFVTLRIDLTRRHAYQKVLRERYQVRGVPTVIFINSNGIEERVLRIESFIDKEEIIKRMQQCMLPVIPSTHG